MSSLMQAESVRHVARQFRRSAATFDSHAAVFDSVGGRLRERLDVLAITPDRILDLGCRSGYQLAALRGLYPESTVIGVDPAPSPRPVAPSSWPSWLRRRARPTPRVAADPHRLPFADESVDLIVSNLLLPWCTAPHAVFGEVARVLSPGGAFLFTSAGPDTLKEYRAAWSRIDGHLHGFGLIDMHDLGDAMLAAGFAAPVLDRDEIHVDYPSIDALQAELRHVGAANVALGRRAGLMSPSVRKALRAETSASDRFVVTLEVVQGHAWKGELSSDRRGSGGEHFVSVDSLRQSVSRR